jgi:hypothetical protein
VLIDAGSIPLGNVSAGNGQNGIAVAGPAAKFITFNTFGGLLAFKGAAPNGNDGLLVTSAGGGNLARRMCSRETRITASSWPERHPGSPSTRTSPA